MVPDAPGADEAAPVPKPAAEEHAVRQPSAPKWRGRPPKTAPGGPAALGSSGPRRVRPGVRATTLAHEGAQALVLVNGEESPLAWLARRTDKTGRPLLAPAQVEAGERLRRDFTQAGLTPRVTVDWGRFGGASGGGAGRAQLSDIALAAKLRLARALTAVGPELNGVLLDVCCFLKGLEDIERERCWPARTAKIVLGLALDRLARHYGLSDDAVGRAGRPLRAWRAPTPEAEGAIG